MNDKYDVTKLSGRINLTMRQRGIKNYSELARMMGVNRQTVNRWINDEGDKLTPLMLFKLADALNASPRWIGLGPAQENVNREPDR